MSVIQPGWMKRWRERRRERRWSADTIATVKWAVEVLTVTTKVA